LYLDLPGPGPFEEILPAQAEAGLVNMEDAAAGVLCICRNSFSQKKNFKTLKQHLSLKNNAFTIFNNYKSVEIMKSSRDHHC
jgi:hypothetical protein